MSCQYCGKSGVGTTDGWCGECDRGNYAITLGFKPKVKEKKVCECSCHSHPGNYFFIHGIMGCGCENPESGISYDDCRYQQYKRTPCSEMFVSYQVIETDT